MKMLCHNICVLIRSKCVLGITLVFDQENAQENLASETALDVKVYLPALAQSNVNASFVVSMPSMHPGR